MVFRGVIPLHASATETAVSAIGDNHLISICKISYLHNPCQLLFHSHPHSSAEGVNLTFG